MKRSTFVLVIILAIFAAASGLAQKKIFLVSDIHVLAPGLIKDGAAIDKEENTGVRMPRESAALLTAVVDRALAEKADALMVTGDLTSNGERKSHEFVVKQLQRLRKAGVKVLVVPGNHDINNAYACSYDGDATKPAATITRSDFARLYAPFCYGSDVKRDPASLSYAAEPFPGLVVLGIDSNLDEENLLKSRGDSVNTYHTNGRVKPATLAWLCREARLARSEGKKVMALMHHHMIEHFDGETELMPNYIVAQAGTVRDSLVAAGVRVVCTGHLHVTDMARDYAAADSVTEIATGPLCSYPFHYRTLTFAGATLQVATHVAADSALVARGKAQMMAAMPHRIKSAMRSMMKKAVAQLGNDLKSKVGDTDFVVNLMYNKMKTPATKAFIALLEGNEDANPDAQAFVKFAESAFQRVGQLIPEKYASMAQEGLDCADVALRSIFCDLNHCATPQQTKVDDHTATIAL